MVDDWEVGSDALLSTVEDQIGEGAFGKVYKATLKELPPPVKDQTLALLTKPGKKKTTLDFPGVAVAIKTLQRKFFPLMLKRCSRCS